MTLLCIAIPTFNRAEKLNRLLGDIAAQLADSPFRNDVEVVVSDNGSDDDTPAVLAAWSIPGVPTRHFRQSENMGLDRNMRFLFQKAEADYVWYFSDDDLMFPGTLDRICRTLRETTPTVLLFSFEQPIGSAEKTFDFPSDPEIITDPNRAIPIMARAPKLSIYVMQRIELDADDLLALKPFLGSDYDFIAVCYSLWWRSASPSLCVISDPLASCDPEFNQIRFSPATWGRSWLVYTHPWVLSVLPDLYQQERRRSHFLLIQALFAVKIGALVVENITEYDAYIRTMSAHWLWLWRRPRSLIQLVLLKMKLTGLWPYLSTRFRSAAPRST